jgi:hypothetical protein
MLDNSVNGNLNVNYYLMVRWQPEGNNMYDDSDFDEDDFMFDEDEEDNESGKDYSQDALIEEYDLPDDEFEDEDGF